MVSAKDLAQREDERETALKRDRREVESEGRGTGLRRFVTEPKRTQRYNANLYVWTTKFLCNAKLKAKNSASK